jgi:hypothetical protein
MICYHGFTQKAISFTIDDGNIPLDRKFISIVKPAGIKGTFNLCGNNTWNLTDEQFRQTYEGFEIANHCYMHPFVMKEGQEYEILSDPFDAENSDKTKIYPTDRNGVYHGYFVKYWSRFATVKAYSALVLEAQQRLQSIFGKGNIKGFVWPYGDQCNPSLHSKICEMGFNSIRKTGCTKGFELPADRMCWSYCANNLNLLSRAAEYEALDTEGELKWFCFGVHSHDFENSDNWCDLVEFAEKYGNRPNDFWYATVSEILEYEDAVKLCEFNGTSYVNRSGIPIYAIVNGERTVIPPEGN